MRVTRRGAGLWPRRTFRPTCIANSIRTSGSACRRTSRCSAIRWRAPDNDLRPGHRRYNFVWYRPASEERELPRLLTDDNGRTHALSIPPPLISRDRVIAGMRADARARARAAVQRDARALCEQPFLQPIYDLEVPRMAFGRVAILGDAAFVARPHVGAGVAKAADDAMMLADALAAEDDMEAALRALRAPRVSGGRAASSRGRGILAPTCRPSSSAPRPNARMPRDTARRRVLAETATMDFFFLAE